MTGSASGNASKVMRVDRITHRRIQELDRERTLVVAAFSPIEVHGPHLPLGQDLMEAYALSEAALARLAARRDDWSFLLLPPMPVAADCVPRIGSISYPVTLVRDVAYHTLRPFAMNGFARLAFTGFHGGPRHNCAMEAAAVRLAREHDTGAISLFSAVLSRALEGKIFFEGIENTPGRKIELDQIKQDHHAGFVETSIGLHLWPDLVEDAWRELEPDVGASPPSGTKGTQHFLYADDSSTGLPGALRTALVRIRAIARAARHFREHTYRGYPALSSADQGRDLFEHLVGVAVEVLEEFLERGKEMDGHSPLWGFRKLLLNPALNKVFDDWLGVYTE